MVDIIEMDESHLSQLGEIEKLCFSTPWSENQLREELDNPLGTYFVAIEDERIMGYIGCQTVLSEACVMNVAVRPDCRGRGIGGLLMERLIRDCVEKDDDLLTLEVRVSNRPALALYARFGFEQVGRRRDYYSAPKEDGLIMTKYFKRNDEQ